MTHDDALDLLRQKLRWLRLPGMAQLLPQLLEQARQDNLTTLDVIDRLCDEERASRMKSAVERRIKDARFPELNTIDGFHFDFDPVRKKLRARYLALHDLSFLAQGINPLFISGHWQDLPRQGARLSRLPGGTPRRRHQRHSHAQRAVRR